MIFLLHRFCRPQKYLQRPSSQLPNSISDWDLKSVKQFQESKIQLERLPRPSGCVYLQWSVCPKSLSLAQNEKKLYFITLRNKKVVSFKQSFVNKYTSFWPEQSPVSWRAPVCACVWAHVCVCVWTEEILRILGTLILFRFLWSFLVFQ